ncbi:hypothetical protein ACLI1A_17415 [Flavobacterium sp. RHBU_3]|uniref:hypothetical protein n=1 Tax=Flavobacterium sp. RHBU_3 TaxID=3391184 RepID=UPI003984FB5C
MQQLLPPDGGIIYTETDMHFLFPEPHNAITSCFFLIIAIYWTVKLWGRGRQHTFLSFALVLLYIGGIGGMIYHGLRQWSFFIMMDWVPIMLLCVFAGIYFISHLTKWYFAALLVVAYMIFWYFLRASLRGTTDIQLYININYAVMACIVLLPVLGYLIKTKFNHGRWVGFAFVSFICALTFRVADPWQWLRWGTHFLWHTFGAVAAFSMFMYLYLINSKIGTAGR